MMKKTYLYLLGMVLVATACMNPMEDIYKTIDEKEIVFEKKVEFTMTDKDYEAIGGNVGDKGYFDKNNKASELIPDLLEDKYPGLGAGSSANVTYNFKGDYPDLSKYTGAAYYKLKEEDYNGASPEVAVAQYFSPLNPADELLPGVLTKAITDADDGDLYIISYMYSDIEPEITPVEEITVFEYEFVSSLGDFTTVDKLGDQDWYPSSYSGTGYAKMSGYSGGSQPNEDWLISPQIDLTGVTGTKFKINQALNYVSGNWDLIKILISDDFNGSDVASATWTEISPATKPTGSNWTFVESEDVDISAFDGKKIYIAFKYMSTDAVAATWEINKVTVTGMGTAKSGIIVDPVRIEEYYTYSSGWRKYTDAYYVKTIDYDAMGSPGRYNNFSSSDNPDNYLPQMLTQKYPYAQEGDVLVVAYRYYSGSTSTRADEYHFMNGKWMNFNPMEVKTDQFILTKSSGWVFDPTVKYTMASADYQIIVDWVKSNKGDDYIDSYGTQEFYYGAGAYYTNYDLRDGKWESAVFDTWQDAVKESHTKVLLPEKFPNAVAQVSGIDVMYEITFATYDGAGGTYTFKYQCTKSGPNPEFEFVEEL